MTPTQDSRAASTRPNRYALGLVAVFLVAVAIRIVHFADISARDPFYAAPVVDAALHDAWARQIIGRTDGHHPPIAQGQAFHKPPLYPYALATVYRAFGGRHGAARGLQLMLGALTCVLIAVLGTRLFDSATGIIAGLMAALYGPLIHFESRLLATGLAVLLSVLVILSVDWARRTPRFWAWLLAGLVLGLAALTRPPLLAAGLALAGWGLWRLRGRMTVSLAAGYLLGAALLIAPVTARNWSVGREFVPICANAGINFYTGNRRGADGYSAVPPGARWEKLQQTARNAGVKDKPGAASRFWLQRGLEELARTPAAEVASLYLRKLAAFLCESEIRNNVSYEFSRRSSRALLPSRLCFGIIGPLALIGLVIAWRTRREAAPPAIFAGAYMLALMPFFVCGRFRLPIIPVFIVLAAFALVWIAREMWAGRRAAAIGMMALALPIGALIHADLTGARAADTAAPDYVLLGNARLFARDLNGAAEAYEESLRLDDTDPDAHFYLAVTLEGRGQAAPAEEQYRRAAELGPDFFYAHSNRGALLIRQGRCEEAKRELERAIEIAPDSATAWVNMGACQAGLGKPTAALDAARRAAALDPRSIQAWLLQCDALLAGAGTPTEAQKAAERARAIDPNHPGVAIALSQIHQARDEHDKAIDELVRAIRRMPGSPDLRLRLGMAFEKAGNKPAAEGVYEQLVEALAGSAYAKTAQAGLERCRGR